MRSLCSDVQHAVTLAGLMNGPSGSGCFDGCYWHVARGVSKVVAWDVSRFFRDLCHRIDGALLGQGSVFLDLRSFRDMAS